MTEKRVIPSVTGTSGISAKYALPESPPKVAISRGNNDNNWPARPLGKANKRSLYSRTILHSDRSVRRRAGSTRVKLRVQRANERFNTRIIHFMRTPSAPVSITRDWISLCDCKDCYSRERQKIDRIVFRTRACVLRIV